MVVLVLLAIRGPDPDPAPSSALFQLTLNHGLVFNWSKRFINEDLKALILLLKLANKLLGGILVDDGLRLDLLGPVRVAKCGQGLWRPRGVSLSWLRREGDRQS